MRQTSATTTTTAIAALLCDDKTRTSTADDTEDLVTRDVTNNPFENDEGSISRTTTSSARCEDDGGERAVVELPSSTRVTNRTSITKTKMKRFCSSCKHNLDAMACFLENRKTCATCLTKHKLYEERRRRQHKAND